jgi:hypothetical protein
MAVCPRRESSQRNSRSASSTLSIKPSHTHSLYIFHALRIANVLHYAAQIIAIAPHSTRRTPQTQIRLCVIESAKYSHHTAYVLRTMRLSPNPSMSDTVHMLKLKYLHAQTSIRHAGFAQAIAHASRSFSSRALCMLAIFSESEVVAEGCPSSTTIAKQARRSIAA